MWWAIAAVLFAIVVLGSAALKAASARAIVDPPGKSCPRCRMTVPEGTSTCPRCYLDFPETEAAERAQARRGQNPW